MKIEVRIRVPLFLLNLDAGCGHPIPVNPSSDLIRLERLNLSEIWLFIELPDGKKAGWSLERWREATQEKCVDIFMDDVLVKPDDFWRLLIQAEPLKLGQEKTIPGSIIQSNGVY